MTEKTRVLINECIGQEGQGVTLKGWVKKVRHLGSISFVLLRDRTGEIQCVLEKKWAGLKLETESAIELSGIVKKTQQTSLGVEVLADEITILSSSAPLPFELSKKTLNAGLDQVLNNRFVSFRHHKINTIFKLKALFVNAFSDFLTDKGFTQIFTPKLVSQGAEGGANVFTLNYFGKEASLAQSPQFYKQMMVGAGFERVFEIAPVYRAEEHNSSRHLNEYISLDVEMGFIEDFRDIMRLETELLKSIFKEIQESFGDELAEYKAEIPIISEIPELTLKEAQKVLKDVYKKDSPVGDLNTEGEKLIGRHIKEKHGSDFVFITHYPAETRPMYTMPNKENPALTDSFDLLYKGTEITSGGQRIHTHGQLLQSFESKGLNPKDFSSYLEAFQYGFPPHGGFAIGLERIIYLFLNLGNVREASAFPRDCDRLIP
ncbi:aspartate--tRNA(Asn) ligase [Peribacillus deserti]|uniref:Aspartate--tRNA ligase n=1 Tax=Peribacillus deserti TaxID=673318 RepID=A0A2N5M6J0_9BACI|nr:aspartate--tRNA(Asn) ligase [Peribacillus deserti]PLT29988.1 aspartate--tRNA(Asn) ligase [Peribacillus deserti]